MIKVEVDARNVLQRLNKMAKNVDTLPWIQVGNLVRESVKDNFTAGGRPNKWVPRKVSKPWPILVKSGTLKNSHYVELIQNGVKVGNKVPYQAVHNFGYPPRNIAQREYLMVQPEDFLKIDNIITNHIKKK